MTNLAAPDENNLAQHVGSVVHQAHVERMPRDNRLTGGVEIACLDFECEAHSLAGESPMQVHPRGHGAPPLAPAAPPCDGCGQGRIGGEEPAPVQCGESIEELKRSLGFDWIALGRAQRNHKRLARAAAEHVRKRTQRSEARDALSFGNAGRPRPEIMVLSAHVSSGTVAGLDSPSLTRAAVAAERQRRP